MILRGLWQLTWLELKIFLREPLGAFGAIAIPVLMFVLVGRVVGGFLGLYGYDKTMPKGAALPCCVAVHAIEVGHLAYDYPEMAQRQRQWFRPDLAAKAVCEPELQSLLAAFVPPAIGSV